MEKWRRLNLTESAERHIISIERVLKNQRTCEKDDI